MIVRISGLRNNREWPAPGETTDLPDAEAADLLRARLAIPADQPRGGRRGRRRPDLPPARPRLPHVPAIAVAQQIGN